MNVKKVSVIIPNYNGKDLLEKNLPSVLKSILFYGKENCELIIVDDFSNDESLIYLEKLSKNLAFLKVLSHKENKGFIEAIHTGVKNSKGDIVVFLNNDVKVPKIFLKKIIYPFTIDKSIFAVSPKVVSSNKISSVSWKIPYFKRGELKYKKWKNLKINKDKIYKTLFCIGGAVAIDRIKFLKLKGFDKIYKPFYYEDVELCVRAWMNGYKCVFYPGVTVFHDHKSTIGKFYSKYFIKSIDRRNRFIFLWSVLPINYLILVHIPNIFLRIFSYSLKGNFSYLTGLILALKKISEIREKRKLYKKFNFFELIKLIEEEIHEGFN